MEPLIHGYLQGIHETGSRVSLFFMVASSSSTPHNTIRKYNIHHFPTQTHNHTTYFNTPGLKTQYFQQRPLHNKHSHRPPHSHYNRHKNKDPPYTYIVSSHLATIGNNKILREPPPRISSSAEILHRITRRTLAQLRTNNSPFLKSYLHKVDAQTHPTPLFPSVTSSHTTHIISSTAPTYAPHCHHIVTPGFVDRPHWSDEAAGQMEREAGCWTKTNKVQGSG